MLPDLNRLKVFYYIYSRQSIVAAAKELNITQSAISQHLKKLEEEIHTPLFIRLHKRLVPTAEAGRLMAIIEPFLHELEAGLRSIKHAKETPVGKLRVGAPVEFGKAYFPGIFAGFRKKYPDVTFSLKLGDPAVLLPMLERGELDFALVDVFLAKSRFAGGRTIYSVDPIIDEEVIMACSKTYQRRAMGEGVSYKNLIGKDYISYHDTLALRNWFRYHYKKSGANLNVVMTVDSVQAVISGISNHLGLGIIPSHLAYGDIRAGRIIPLTTKRKEIINRISLVQLLDKVPSLTEKTFLGHFTAAVGKAGMLKKFAKIARPERS